MLSTDVFQSWDETLLQQSLLLTFHAMRWQDLSPGKHRELASCGIFTQPQCVRSLDALPWLRYNNFPEVNPSHKSDRHTSIFLLIPHSQQDLLILSGSTVSVWHEVCWAKHKECKRWIGSDSTEFRSHLLRYHS